MKQSFNSKVLVLLLTIAALAVGQSAWAAGTFTVNVTFNGLMNGGKYQYVISSGLGHYSSGVQDLNEIAHYFDNQVFDLGNNDVPLTLTVYGSFSFPQTAGDFTTYGSGNELTFTSTTKYFLGASVYTGSNETVTDFAIEGLNSKSITIRIQDGITFGKVTLTMAVHTPLTYAATIEGIEDTYLDDGVNNPVPTVTYQEGSSPAITLTEGEDYSLEYTIGSTSGTVIVRGMGDYVGYVTKKYNIRQLQLSDFTQLSDGSYEIASTDDLDNLAKFVNNGNNCQGVTFRQTTDIVYTYACECTWDNGAVSTLSDNHNFTPIGGYGKPFKGTYDGGGNTISGIRIYRAGSGTSGHDDQSVGLFGYVSDGTVQNVVMRDANIYAYQDFAGIVGYLGGGTVTSCTLYHVHVATSITSFNNQNIVVGNHASGTVSGNYYRDCIRRHPLLQSPYVYIERWDNVYTVSTAANTSATYQSGASVTIDGTTYYAEGSDVTLAYTGGTESFTMPAMDVIPLLNDHDNADIIAANQGSGKNVILTGRALYRDGYWNTLCLPFDVAIEGSVLDGATAMTLSSSSFAGGTLTLNFTAVSSIEAGKPFIIKWTSGEGIKDPVFSGVTIAGSAIDDIESDYVTFKGTYSPMTFESADRSILFMGANSKFYYPGAGASIGAQRAYFELDGITAGDLGSDIKSFVLNFEDDATSIQNSKFKIQKEDSGWYTLDGVRLAGKPSQKGIYIHNGRKEALK